MSFTIHRNRAIQVTKGQRKFYLASMRELTSDVREALKFSEGVVINIIPALRRVGRISKEEQYLTTAEAVIVKENS